MKILVTGAKGMLGQDLCPVLEDEDFEVVETDIHNLDITDINQVKKMITEEKPDMVIHCAGYTNVDLAEAEPEKAEKINTLGTENLAKTCGKNDITMIYISTDYVFDGTNDKPYKPEDEPNPQSVYGKTKRGGEIAVQKYCEKYYITRTSWLYGHHGKNFVETMISISQNPEIKVVDDQTGCPTWTMELCNGIVKLINEEAPYGIYHICGSEPTTWYNFAKEIYHLMKLDVNLKPCTTDEYPRPAKRPHYSAMDNDGICRNWKLALKDYLKLRD